MSTNVIVDTNLIINKSKDIFTFLSQRNYNPVFSTVALFEYLVFIREKFIEQRKLNKKERANGYIEAARIVLERVAMAGNQLVSPSNDFLKGLEISKERDVDVGDAILASMAKERGLRVITADRDWERLKDFADCDFI